MSSTKWRSYLASVLTIAAAMLIAFGVVYYRQAIFDTVHAMQYQPSAQMASIRDKLGLTAKGKALFDASQPQIEAATTFNQSCQQREETNSPILGCYISQQIFVYEVTNQKLDGIEETTAAHELLHAAYERLNSTERAKLNTELTSVYQKVKTSELEERMQHYRESEPGQELNELHSILGTEFANLGPKLESHYAQYFKDRKKVLGYFDAYSSVFDSAKNRLKSLQTQINSQTERVNGEIKAYNQDSDQLKKDAATFNRRADSGDFPTSSEFNAARNTIIDRQAKLASMRTAIIKSINEIDAWRTEYNQLAKEYNQLNQSINSSLAPAPKL